MSRNDITGDKIRTKGILSEKGRDSYERIFGKKTKATDTCVEHEQLQPQKEKEDEAKKSNKL
jgi:hypothetical protein